MVVVATRSAQDKALADLLEQTRIESLTSKSDRERWTSPSAATKGLPRCDAATFLRNKCRGLRVLMVGGLTDDDRLRYRMTLEGFEVFPKPFTGTALLEKLNDVLHKVPRRA
jgi:hypothetical protein